MYSKFDLHTHTTASDGTYAPKELVTTATARRLRVLAITDHDSTEGLEEARAAAEGSALELWPGVELSTDVPGSEVHILGYCVDPTLPVFQRKLRQLRDSRFDRARRMVAKLADLGVSISWQRVQEIAAGGAIGRPHIAQALCEKGYVADLPDAFSRFIGRDGPAYVERFRLSPEEAVRLVLSAKGIPALAHPIVVAFDGHSAVEPSEILRLENLLPTLVREGLAAVEVYYPGYNRALTQRLLRIADRWQLIGTGGSDFHGRGALTIGVGEIAIPEHVIMRLRQWQAEHSREDRQDRPVKKSA